MPESELLGYDWIINQPGGKQSLLPTRNWNVMYLLSVFPVLDYFYKWGQLNSAPINLQMQISPQNTYFRSFGYIINSEIAGSYSSSTVVVL